MPPQKNSARHSIEIAVFLLCAAALAGVEFKIQNAFNRKLSEPAASHHHDIEFWSSIRNLRYQNADDGTYSAGIGDAWIVAYLVLVLTCLRRIIQDIIFVPIAQLSGISDRQRVIKFKTQGWVFCYYLSAFVWGFLEIKDAPYYFNTKELWSTYPQTLRMDATFKLYFLCQLAFWVHMVFVTLVEPWQKDFAIMMIHHFIAITMLLGGYGSGFLRVTHAILVEQDLADIVLPAAKMFNYIAEAGGKTQTIADGLFAMFAAAWIPTRHILLPIIYYSIIFELPAAYDNGKSNCNCGHGDSCVWDPSRSCLLDETTMPVLVGGYAVLLFIFQVLLCIWLKDLIVAIIKAFKGTNLQELEKQSLQGQQETKPKVE